MLYHAINYYVLEGICFCCGLISYLVHFIRCLADLARIYWRMILLTAHESPDYSMPVCWCFFLTEGDSP